MVPRGRHVRTPSRQRQRTTGAKSHVPFLHVPPPQRVPLGLLVETHCPVVALHAAVAHGPVGQMVGVPAQAPLPSHTSCVVHLLWSSQPVPAAAQPSLVHPQPIIGGGCPEVGPVVGAPQTASDSRGMSPTPTTTTKIVAIPLDTPFPIPAAYAQTDGAVTAASRRWLRAGPRATPALEVRGDLVREVLGGGQQRRGEHRVHKGARRAAGVHAQTELELRGRTALAGGQRTHDARAVHAAEEEAEDRVEDAPEEGALGERRGRGGGGRGRPGRRLRGTVV